MKKKINRTIAYLIILCMMICVPAVAYGADAALDVTYEGQIKCGEEVTFTANVTGGTGTYRYLFNSVMLNYDGKWEDQIDPTHFSYTYDNTFKFTFMASGTYRIKCWALSSDYKDYISKEIVITIEDENYPSVEKIADSVTKQCIDAGCNDDYSRALWLHDWLLENCTYDSVNLQPGYYCGIEGALARGKCICEGYRAAYEYLLKKVGIESKRMTGNGHTWNAVKMDGEWYQTDVTWDDNG